MLSNYISETTYPESHCLSHWHVIPLFSIKNGCTAQCHDSDPNSLVRLVPHNTKMTRSRDHENFDRFCPSGSTIRNARNVQFKTNEAIYLFPQRKETPFHAELAAWQIAPLYARQHAVAALHLPLQIHHSRQFLPCHFQPHLQSMG